MKFGIGLAIGILAGGLMALLSLCMVRVCGEGDNYKENESDKSETSGETKSEV